MTAFDFRRLSTLLLCGCLLLLLQLTPRTHARAVEDLSNPRSSRSQHRLVRRGHAFLRRALSRRAPIDIVTEDGGSLSLAKLLELRREQQLELEQWWNGTLPANSTWAVKLDDTRLQAVLPEQLRSPSFAELNSSDGSAFYWNISGYYKGQYSAVDLVPLPGNETLLPNQPLKTPDSNASEPNIERVRGNFPWLDPAGGTIDLEISEDHKISRNLTMIQGNVYLKSKAQSRSLWSSDVLTGASVRFDLTGVHYLQNGGLLLSALPAESTEVPDSRMVLNMLPPSILPSTPQQAPSEIPQPVLNETFHSINETLHQDIERLTDLVGDKDPTEPLSPAADERITHNCTDMHLYLRLAPATPPHASPAQIDQLREYEHEIFFSTGASPMGLFSQHARPLQLSHALFYSEKCNLVIHAGGKRNMAGEVEGGLGGLRYVAHRGKIMRAALCLALITLLQLKLTMNMMRRARTASARVKIDWRTLLLQTVADMYTSILCAIPAVVWRNETDLLLAAVSYVVGCHFVGGEYQFLIFVVHDSQNDPLNNRPPPQPTAATAAAAAATPAPAPAAAAPAGAAATTETPTPTTPAGADAAPAPEGAVEPEDPVAAARRQRSYRYIGVLVFFFLLNFQPLVFFSLLGPVLYSFWIPQIMRNVRRGSRRPFPRKYIIGMTACRCLMPLYFWQCPNNIFFWEPTPLIWILIGYLWAQAIILLLQDELGPAFFLPARFQPEGLPSWDWHPPLSVLRKHIRQGGGGGKGDSPPSNNPAAELERGARLDAAAAAGDTSGAHKHGAQYEIEIGDCAICLSEIESLRWDWRDEEADAQGPEGESEEDEEDGGGADGDRDEYAYVSVDGADGDPGVDAASSRARGGSSAGAGGAASNLERGSSSNASGGSGNSRRRRHLRTGSLITSWASSAVRVGRRVGRAISAAREHGGRGRSSAAAASAALGGGRTDIMVAPCHHIFHTECLERWLQYKSECPSCRMPLPPA
ncbi:hypothetical protein A4X13_0g5267 [Tilletia indica]|uniref:RING-type E3 ubiquitin transferase n=1 Tax=Tilletia indica TaxID=43049 RepID=A0A8T8SUI0_9BASI|nr:hypothetical protein A4X13_0g5267 [Tilletia indica]